MSIEVGNAASEFRLFDTDRKERTLTEFLGRTTVLAFYPGAFTNVCTNELCTFRDMLVNLNELKAQVVGISVDSPFANKAFSDANNLNFPLLSDYTRIVSNMYCGVYNDFAGLKGYSAAKRSIFILSADGIIRYKWVSEEPGKEPPYEEMIKVIEAL